MQLSGQQWLRDELTAALTVTDPSNGDSPMLSEDERQMIRARMEVLVETLHQRTKEAVMAGDEDEYPADHAWPRVLAHVLGDDLGGKLERAWEMLYA